METDNLRWSNDNCVFTIMCANWKRGQPIYLLEAHQFLKIVFILGWVVAFWLVVKKQRLTRFNHKLSSYDKHIESHDTATPFGKILRHYDWKKKKKNINARLHWTQQITTPKLQRGRRGFNQGAKENIALKIYDNRQIAAVYGENKSTVETNMPVTWQLERQEDSNPQPTEKP